MTWRETLNEIYAPKLGRSAWRGPYGLCQRRRYRPGPDCSGYLFADPVYGNPWVSSPYGALNLGIVRDDDFYRRNDLTIFAEEAVNGRRVTVTWKRDGDDPNYDDLIATLTGGAVAGPLIPCSVDPVFVGGPEDLYEELPGTLYDEHGLTLGGFLYLDGGTLDMGVIRSVIGWRTIRWAVLRPWKWRTVPGLIRRYGKPVHGGNDFTLFKEAFSDVGR